MATAPDVSGWDVSGFTSLDSMFSDCYSMATTPDISGWVTNNVQDWDFFMADCNNAVSPVVTGLNFTSADDFRSAFRNDGTRGVTISAADVDTMFVNMDAQNAVPSGLRIYYEPLTSNAHLDANRSGAASAAIANLIANGAIRTGTY